MHVVKTINKGDPVHGTPYIDVKEWWKNNPNGYVFFHNQQDRKGYLIPLSIAVHWHEFNATRENQVQVRWKMIIDSSEYQNAILEFSTVEDQRMS